ncbi:MAG: TonB-dependent receptor plug domain-containing protein [Bacteroidia bacterium]|nr:TonB-dependent receptor plug domain-containing protein [Bacteroidia bacterium]
MKPDQDLNFWLINIRRSVKLRFIFSLFILLLAGSSVFSQEVEVVAYNAPLNKILIGLRDKYKLQFSFNDRLLSQYNLSISRKFPSPDDAIQSLINGLPLICQKKRDVFMIVPEKKVVSQRNYLLFGQIAEAKTNEPLPFSRLFVDDRIVVSDLKGSFSYQSSDDSLFRIRVSHLGYYLLDTVLVAGINHQLKLTPSIIGLREIIIKDKSPDRSTQISKKAGVMTINHQLARYLPGNGDNSVFTLLRLMPGILASSEQSNGLIIWGSYEGHSEILFDGFTIWGLKSFDDDIDVVNPLIAKEIEVFKGGYDATLGDRVGGIVRISGKSGSTIKPSFSLNINNVTMNGMVEVPLWKNSSLLLAFRQTYYNLYNGKDILPANNRNVVIPVSRSNPNIDYTVFPDYNYRDANIKFTTRNDNGELFSLSLIGAGDRFKYTINQLSGNNSLFKISSENNNQYGGSAFYGRTWRNGNITNITTSWSSIKTDLSDIQKVVSTNNIIIVKRDEQTYNQISEFSGRADNFVSLSPSHRLENGIGFEMNNVGLRADSSGVTQTNLKTQVYRMNGYLQDHITLPGEVDIKFGFRADIPFNLNKIYIQPRLSTSIKVTDFIKLNAALGIYNQFISKSSVVDEQGNYRYIWTACDNKDVPVLRAVHWVLGSSYHQNDFTFSVEAYLKNTDGLTRFIRKSQRFKDLIYRGEGRSYGLDFFVKKDFRGHSAWISYTLSKTEERFSYFSQYQFRAAAQDQRHELKAAVIFNVKPFSFSANYVFGSGFLFNNGTATKPDYINPDYNRMDVAVNYRFNIGKVAAETGLSVLNLFNSKNIRYSNFEKVPSDQSTTLNIYSEAVPFSPRLSLRLFY